jgi:hypothetical protein
MEKATPQREAALTCTDIQETKAYSSPSQELATRIKKVLPKLSSVRTRLVLHLVHRKKDTTGSICNKCSIGNLSDTVIKIQPLLNKYGLEIRNYPPNKALLNSHGERTFVHYWELGVLDG